MVLPFLLKLIVLRQNMSCILVKSLCFLSTFNWVHEFNLGPLDFEFDAKVVIESASHSIGNFLMISVTLFLCKVVLIFSIATLMLRLLPDNERRLLTIWKR